MVLTVHEAALTLNVSDMTLYRRVRNGEIPAFHVGGAIRIKAEDLEKFVEDGKELMKQTLDNSPYMSINDLQKKIRCVIVYGISTYQKGRMSVYQDRSSDCDSRRKV